MTQKTSTKSKSNKDTGNNPWKKFKASNFFQAAFFRPFPSGDRYKYKRFRAFLAYSLGLVFTITSCETLIDYNLSSLVPLSQMDRDEGKIIKISFGRRGIGEGYFVIRTSDSKQKTFYVFSSTLRNLSPGKTVIIWSQKGFIFSAGIIHHAREVQLADKDINLTEYTKELPMLSIRKKQITHWSIAELILGVLLLILPWWKHRNPKQTTQQT